MARKTAKGRGRARQPEPFDVTIREVDAGYRQACAINVLGEDPDRPLDASQYRARKIADIALGSDLRHRKPSARFIPSVNLMLDGTLYTLGQPDVTQRMAHIKEVKDRVIIAQKCATDIAFAVVQDGSVHTQYIDEHARLGLLPSTPQEERQFESEVQAFDNVGYLADLAAVTFLDVGIVAGGALRALYDAGIRENTAEIIAGSPILDTAGIYKGEITFEAREYIGIPYARPDNFVIFEDDDLGYKLTYTDETSQALHRMYTAGSGCPAWGVRIEAGGPTLLAEGWSSIVHYLITDGATVDATS